MKIILKAVPLSKVPPENTAKEKQQIIMTQIAFNPVALVAGGAGFIGSHLCDRLIDDGYKVICIDNLYTGSLHNIEHLMSHPRFTFVNHDVTAPYDMTGLSLIFNLACPASPVHYQKDAVYTSKTAYLGTLNMLDLACKNDCVMLQASTSEVYGNPLVHPQPESYWGNVNPIGIRSCYDEGKRIGETLCMDYHRQYGTKVKIVRIFNTYGPRMAEDDGRVVSNFINQALRGDDITIYGDGSQTRSFQYISDLIEGFMRIIKTDENLTGPINLGNPCEYTIKQLAETIIRITGSSSRIINLSLPKDDPTRRKPDVSNAKEKLGWKAKIKLEKGIKFMIDNIKKYSKRKECILFICHKDGLEYFSRYNTIKESIDNTRFELYWVLDGDNEYDMSKFKKSNINLYIFNRNHLNELQYYPFYDQLYGNEHLIIESFYLDKPYYNNYWVIEYDVFFNDTWNNLFNSFWDNDADMLSSHVELFNPQRNGNWVWWDCIGLCDEQKIKVDHLVKSFNPICRFSNRALAYLDKEFKKENSGHYEILPVTLLYNNNFIIEDFGGKGDFVSSQNINKFYIDDDGLNEGSNRPYPEFTLDILKCNNYQGKIIHPIK